MVDFGEKRIWFHNFATSLYNACARARAHAIGTEKSFTFMFSRAVLNSYIYDYVIEKKERALVLLECASTVCLSCDRPGPSESALIYPLSLRSASSSQLSCSVSGAGAATGAPTLLGDGGAAGDDGSGLLTGLRLRAPPPPSNEPRAELACRRALW
jgi:hypothetical protein